MRILNQGMVVFHLWVDFTHRALPKSPIPKLENPEVRVELQSHESFSIFLNDLSMFFLWIYWCFYMILSSIIQESMNYPIFANWILKCRYWLMIVKCYRIMNVMNWLLESCLLSMHNIIIIGVLIECNPWSLKCELW